MLLHPGLGLCQKICPAPSLDKLEVIFPNLDKPNLPNLDKRFWKLYFLKPRSLEVLREYEVGGSSGGAQVISRNRLAPLLKSRVKGDVYQC